MATVASFVNEVKRHLLGMHRAEFNTLSSSYTAGGTTLSLTYDLQGLARGSYVSIDDEILYVFAVDTSALTATVVGAQLGSSAANHASGALVEVNPRFPAFAIKEELKNEIRSWGKQLFAVAEANVTMADAAVRGLDLALSSYYDILRVHRDKQSETGVSDSKSWVPVGYRVDRMASADFTTGPVLTVQDFLADGSRLHVVYSKPMDVSTFADGTTHTTIGIPDSAVDIPALGAAWRLMAAREVKRTFTEAQGEPRRAEEVQAGHISQLAQNLKRIRDQRLAEEEMRLLAQWGMRAW